MKLIYRILIHLSWVAGLLLTLWAFLFYMAIWEEVNDEVDDSLDSYSETIMLRALAGEELPTQQTGSNNQFYMQAVSEHYAAVNSHIQYLDSMVYIAEKGEKEPARILRTIFCDDEDNYYQLTVFMPTIEKDDLEKAIVGWIALLYLALLLLMVVVAAWVLYRNLRPLYVLLHWIEKYRIGQKNEPLCNKTIVTEFRQLNNVIKESMARNEQLFEQQKQFIGNASHELQTPLAVCRNRLEMLMEDEDLKPGQLDELLRIYRSLERMTRLNKSLLLLSRIENRQYDDVVSVNFNKIVTKYRDDYEEAYAFRAITVKIMEEGDFRADMSEALAVILVTNLWKNAFVHNVTNGEIEVTIGHTEICFCNTGKATALSDRVFERFYHDDRQNESTGLGLSIVLSICRLSRLSIRYEWRNQRHCFVIEKERTT